MFNKKIIIIILGIWLGGIVVGGWLLFVRGAVDSKYNTKQLKAKKEVVSSEKVLQEMIHRGDFFYNTDADADIKYAKAIYDCQINEINLFSGDGGIVEDKINKVINSITKTTGSGNLLGWVIYYDNPGSKYIASAEYNIKTRQWDIFVNLSMARENEQETIITIIHEFAHIISLNKEQMYTKIPQKICWTHFVPEGCLKKESYLYKFWREFWKGNYLENELDTDGYAKEHYQKSPDKYVTEYAATNPAEDFAESFMFFITGDDYGNKQIAGKKVDFFQQYSEFYKAKSDILQNFKNILK